MKLLCLDLSTQSSGWAYFIDGELDSSGVIKPQVKGLSKLKYPDGAYIRTVDMGDKIKALLLEKPADKIIIEEINRGISRIGNKVLAFVHFVAMDRMYSISPDLLKKIVYYDSNGAKGWRGKLGLALDAQDKAWNKQAREFNKANKKAIKSGTKEEQPIIDWKDLSIRFTNKTLNMDIKRSDSGSDDLADAICLGLAFLKK